MEDKIEIGEYVRTNNKGIRKIDRIDNNKTVNKYLYFTGIEDFEGKEYGIIKTTEIVKHSKQLIDLIEVGDVIKYFSRYLGKELKMEVNYICKKENDYKWGLGYVDTNIDEYIVIEDIKTILTKESYIANCYKGGEENEI